MIDPVELLARDDKWQLAAGDGTQFAPAFPRWLDVPGFWDGASILQHGVSPLFAVTVLDDDGHEIPARATARRWTPAELTLQYRFGQGITATEVRSVHPGGIFVSEWRFAAYRPERVHLVAWTAQRASRVETGSAKWNGALQFVVAAKKSEEDETALRARAELACVGGAASWSAIRSEGRSPEPAWALTPFVEQWRGGVLPKVVRMEDDAPPGGTFFGAVHRALEIDYGGVSATFAMRLIADDDSARPAESAAAGTSKQRTYGGTSRKRWADYFAGVPAFRCSDPYIETLYWYLAYIKRANPSATPAVKSYAENQEAAARLTEDRDRDKSGLFDLERTDPSLDVRTEDATRIKSIEASVRAYELFRQLEKQSAAAGESSDRWAQLAERTRTAVREKMWNPVSEMFSDVDARTLARTNVKHARCFLPYRTDIVDASHVPGLEKHLLNPKEFATAFPVPSLSADDPRFSPEGDWLGRRAAIPWNGRNHPEVSVQVIDALAHAARTIAPSLRKPAGEMLRRFVRTFFHNGNLHGVNSHEHYNPFTGHASVFRGVDDIDHPGLADLILRHVTGIVGDENGVSIDPLPLGLEYAEASSVTVSGHTIDVLIENQAVTATRDGEKFASTIGSPIVFGHLVRRDAMS